MDIVVFLELRISALGENQCFLNRKLDFSKGDLVKFIELKRLTYWSNYLA